MTKRADRLSAALARARDVSERMNTAIGELNKAIISAENAIAALNLGVTAAVDLTGPHDEFEQCLRFGKENGHWCLTVESAPLNPEPEDWDSNPLLNTSRETRIKAVEKLPDLVDKLVARAESEIIEVETAATQVEAFVQRVREGDQ